MPQGMVKSLVFIHEKLLLVVDIWVIAVLNHPFKAQCKKAAAKGVKEQRVDGSLSSTPPYNPRKLAGVGNPRKLAGVGK